MISAEWRVSAALALADMIRDRGEIKTATERALDDRRVEMLNVVLTCSDPQDMASRLVGAML